LAIAARAAFPYLLLVGVILLARLWHSAPALHPFTNLPGFGLTHVGVLLLLVAGGLLLAGPDTAARAGSAFRRAAKPALAMLLYVCLGRLLAGSGAAAGLARALAEALGPLAPAAVPVLGFVSGMVTGSNVGSNAALMPIQQGIGEAAGLPPSLAPGVQNFVSSAGVGMGFTSTALMVGLLADGSTPAGIWHRLAPSMAMVLALGLAMMVAGR
jgi:lactate permease